MMRRLKTRRRSAEIPRDSIDHGATGLLPLAANKNNPICANAAKFESPSIVPPFINSPFSTKGASSASSPENYRSSTPGERAPQSTERKTEAVRDEIRAEPLIHSRKTADPSEDSFQPREPTTNQRESQWTIRLVVAMGIIIFPEQRHDRERLKISRWCPETDPCRAMPHARATTPLKRINLFGTNFAGFHLHRRWI